MNGGNRVITELAGGHPQRSATTDAQHQRVARLFGNYGAFFGKKHRRNIRCRYLQQVLPEFTFEDENLLCIIRLADLHQMSPPAVVLAGDQAVGLQVITFFGKSVVP